MARAPLHTQQRKCERDRLESESAGSHACPARIFTSTLLFPQYKEVCRQDMSTKLIFNTDFPGAVSSVSDATRSTRKLKIFVVENTRPRARAPARLTAHVCCRRVGPKRSRHDGQVPTSVPMTDEGEAPGPPPGVAIVGWVVTHSLNWSRDGQDDAARTRRGFGCAWISMH
jgi:hypothetical protein